MPTFEYRRLLRANTVIKVEYKTIKTPTLTGVALSKNLSSTGINIVMPHTLERGERIELTIFIPEQETPISARGKVMWQAECEYIPSSKKHYYSTGIQFNYMSSQDAITTSDFVRVVLQEESQERVKKIIQLLESLKKS
ncbi:PilZ domain-containing protein [Candidatus Omnitrophota bacterium]